MHHITSLLLVLLFGATPLLAIPVTKIASSDGTIENTGPSSSPWFHNAQVPGSFEQYAISSYSFTASDFGLPAVTGISSVNISYMQNNAFFTTDGPVEFFVSFDTGVGGGSYGGLSHNSVGSGIDATQFSDTPVSVGTGTFTETATGDVDTYALNVSGASETALVNAINSGNPFSIMLTAPSGSTAATYAGIQSNSYVINGGSTPDNLRTNLTVDAIPEPTTFLTVVVFGLGLILYRTRARRNG